MTQKELVKAVTTDVNTGYEAAGKKTLTEGNVSDVLGSFVKVTTDAIAKNDKVQLAGFGTFSLSVREAREGRNPQTGATIQIAASKGAKFKAGKALKDALNN